MVLTTVALLTDFAKLARNRQAYGSSRKRAVGEFLLVLMQVDYFV